MAGLAQQILAVLMSLRSAARIVVPALLVLILWAALRRSGRKGLDLAMVLLLGAAVSFGAAVFAQRPLMSETLAMALAALSAVLLVAGVAAAVWYAVRQRRAPPLIEHRRPPWEDGGW